MKSLGKENDDEFIGFAEKPKLSSPYESPLHSARFETMVNRYTPRSPLKEESSREEAKITKIPKQKRRKVRNSERSLD